MEKAKPSILIYAHYYLPDVASTGQIVSELAEGLLADFEVTVVCTVPSYSGSIDEKYKKEAVFCETINNVKVLRVQVPEFNKRQKISRIKNVLAYCWRSFVLTRKLNDFDYVFAISQPPVFGGLLGLYGCLKMHAKLIYNIQDFNPEQIMITGYSHASWLLYGLLWLDKMTCIRASKIIVVGRDQLDTLAKRFGYLPQKAICINNWIDEKSIRPLSSNEKVKMFRQAYDLENKFIIMYSGNLGLYYDLLNILKVIEHFPTGSKHIGGKEVAFVFIGNGNQKHAMQMYCNKHVMNNVYFIPYQDKEKLVYSLNAADVHWCVNAKGIEGISCPSKFYGIVACAKPVLGVLGNNTEIRSLIEKIGCGFCVNPGDYTAIEDSLHQILMTSEEKLILMGKSGRKYLEKNLSKEGSIRRYKEAILSI